MNRACLALLLALPCAVHASDAWLSLGGVSRHTSGDYQERNIGVGVEVQLAPGGNTRMLAGAYRNSLDRSSAYLMAETVIWRRGPVGAGIVYGGATGYGWGIAGITPIALPSVVIDGDTVGLRVVLIPEIEKRVSGAVAVQFRLRFN